MSKTVKRRMSSMSYSLNKIYQRFSTTKPSTSILSAITIALAIFLFGGGVYNLIVRPYPAVYYGGHFILIYPQVSEQFIADSLVATILYAFGTIGLIMIYQSTKYAYKPRQAYMMFIVGATLLLLAYASLELVMHIWKGV
ncbi:hypothetical protein HXY33_07985 [Candidatus Bathyarchaeota archaeon]|nr:hypothetical protein [Candidatus Bathyarchaeota archaeon]